MRVWSVSLHFALTICYSKQVFSFKLKFCSCNQVCYLEPCNLILPAPLTFNACKMELSVDQHDGIKRDIHSCWWDCQILQVGAKECKNNLLFLKLEVSAAYAIAYGCQNFSCLSPLRLSTAQAVRGCARILYLLRQKVLIYRQTETLPWTPFYMFRSYWIFQLQNFA